MMALNDNQSRLQELKAKNAARLMRNDAARLLGRLAPVLAALCDRFTIHVDKARAKELSAFADRFHGFGDWYLKGEAYGHPHQEKTRAALNKLIEEHGLAGDVEFAACSPNTGVRIIIGVATASLPDVIPAILDMMTLPGQPYDETLQLEDCWLVNRADNWGLLIWHEGLIILEHADASTSGQPETPLNQREDDHCKPDMY